MKLTNQIKEKTLAYVFTLSRQPVLYRDLLRANALYNEGMHVDPAVLNFRTNISNAYVIYAIVCAIVLAPLIAISHAVLINVDFHVSIVGTIFATSCVFVGFQFFQDWLRDEMTGRLIRQAWSIHFPHFSYEKYSERVEELYTELKRNEIPHKEWEHYVINKLANVTNQ